MSDYIKATNFTSKDTLPTGNANKIVKGTEIDTEFTAIASAVASKANSDGPTFTGVPLAPTAAAGTSSSQIATTSFVTSERTNTATLTNKTLTSPTINTPTVTDATITGGTITGITDITVADGGTGSSTLAVNAVLLGNGTSALQTVAPGSAGNSLISDGTTWTSIPGYVGNKGQFFSANGTFTVPSGITALKVTIAGGGGGGGGAKDYPATPVNGSAGSSTVFGSLATVTGGGGGYGANAATNGTGVGSNGSNGSCSVAAYGISSIFSNTSGSSIYSGLGGAGGTWYDGTNSMQITGGRGGSSIVSVVYLTGVTPGASISITIGAGGAGGTGLGTSAIAGANGLCLVEW